MPRLLRTASFRLAALYLLLFTASALVLGGAVFWIMRAALDGQARARIEAEIASLREEYQAGGLARLVAVVDARGRGAGALDYLVQDRMQRFGQAVAEAPEFSGLFNTAGQ